MRSNRRLRTLVFLLIGSVCGQVSGHAQVASTAPPPAPAAPKSGQATTRVRSGPVIVENRLTAPQVVTILHRLNGLKMFRLIVRSSQELRAITRLEDDFNITDEIHTNVIAGLALDDGQTIVAWLPDAEAELGPPPSPFAPVAPVAPMAPDLSTQSPRATTVTPAAPVMTGPANFFERPDLTVIARDGKRLAARYVGLDGVTGLSILKINDKSLPGAIDAKEGGLDIGQRVRLFGPEPVPKPESRTRGTIYARMGETAGTVVQLARSPSGSIARVKIGSAKLSAANIGGIAVNDAGETVGIVDAVEDSEASVVPSAMVRTAAKRVLDRQASVPRPWLGVWGEPVGLLELDQIVLKGWKREGARLLAEARRGIMLIRPRLGPAAGGARVGQHARRGQDAQGHMYVHHTVHATSERADTVVVFDSKGTYVRSWGKEFRGVAHGLHIRREGKEEFLYLTANAANPKMTPQPGKQAAVVKTTLKGEVVWSIDAPPAVDGYKPAADGTPARYNPTNVAIAPNGDVYVADGYGSFYINQYNAKAKHIRTFGGRGSEPGKLIEPHGIWMDTRGASPVLVVADRRNNRLQRFTLDGQHVDFVPGFRLPCHFDEHKGLVVVPDLHGRVTLLDKQNAIVAHLGDSQIRSGTTRCAASRGTSSSRAGSSARTAPASTATATSSWSSGSKSGASPSCGRSKPPRAACPPATQEAP